MGGGYEGTKKFVSLKRASHFWPCPKFHFSREQIFLGASGWLGLGGRVRQITRPPSPVDKNIPAPDLLRSDE